MYLWDLFGVNNMTVLIQDTISRNGFLLWSRIWVQFANIIDRRMNFPFLLTER
jgi:hypothetical protein